MPNMIHSERVVIEKLYKSGKNAVFIANCLDRNKTTIYRELTKVNPDTGAYEADYANELTSSNLSHPIYKGPSEDTIDIIEHYLTCFQWSPEQISGWLKLHKNITVSHTWIYQYIAKDKVEGGELSNHLRHGNYIMGGKEYKGKILDRNSIENRPAEANERQRIGDFEIDLIVGPKNRGAILTAIDRKSRLCVLEKLDNKKADTVAAACVKAIQRIKTGAFTITSDNGTEFTNHKEISKSLNLDYYFAHPYASYERGSIENLNGLVRQYIPKKTEFTNIASKQLLEIEHKLNNRPRKILKYLTPIEYIDKINGEKKVAIG